MPKLSLYDVFNTTVFVDPAVILNKLYFLSKDGVLAVEGIPYDDGYGSYRFTMSESWGKEDEAVAVYKITKGAVYENAPFSKECKARTVRLAKLESLGAPVAVIENERFFLTFAKIINNYAIDVTPLN